MNIPEFRKLRESVEYDLSGLLDKAEDRIDALEAEVQAKKDKLDDVQEDLDAARDEALDLQGRLSEAEQRYAELVETVSTRTDQAAQAEGK